MKKSKLTMLAAVAALSSLLVVGGTLAWFTDTETATNVVNVGNVKVGLYEDLIISKEHKSWTAQGTGPVGDSIDGIAYSGVMPGTIIDKRVVIFNKGNNDAYVRAKIEVVSDTALDYSGLKYYSVTKEQLDTLFKDVDSVDATAADWSEFIKETGHEIVLDEGYIYYDGIMAPDVDWEYPLIAVEFPGAEWGNEYMNANFSIKVVAEAIQADNIDVTGAANGIEAAKLAFANFTADDQQ